MAPGAATSPMVASNPDGRGAVYGSVVTACIWQATRYDKGSPVVPISLTDFPFFWEGSVIFQLVYELQGKSEQFPFKNALPYFLLVEVLLDGEPNCLRNRHTTTMKEQAKRLLPSQRRIVSPAMSPFRLHNKKGVSGLLVE
jgi:hypothetical protein